MLQPYATVKNELSIVNGILLKGQRIVIPSKLQMDILNRLAEITKCIETSQKRATHQREAEAKLQ